MKRRKFLLASGTGVLGGTGLSSVLQRPSVAVNFNIVQVDNVNPSNADSVLVDFQNFELLPKYIDETSEPATVSIKLSVENHDSKTVSVDVPFVNGEVVDKSDLKSAVPITKNSLNSDKNELDGQVKIKVDHPSISDSFTREFKINKKNTGIKSFSDKLVGWWPLHEWSGRANDLSGSENHGVVTGATQGVAGVSGLTSYSFDGSNDKVITGQKNLDMDKVGFTMMTWWKCGSESNTDRVISKRDSQNRGYELVPRDDVISVSIGDDSGITHLDVGSTDITDDAWHHIAAVIEPPSNGSRTCQVYLDGEPDGTEEFSRTGSINSTADLRIGTRGTTSYYEGNIFDVRVYDRLLADSEITDVYQSGISNSTDSSLHDGSDSSGIARWAFDNSSTSKAEDSWNGNDGTVSGLSYDSDAIRGKSLKLNGSDYFDAEKSLYPTGSKTLSIWFRYDEDGLDSSSGGDAYLFEQEDSSGDIQALYYNDDTQVIFLNSGTTEVGYNINIPPDVWNLVTYTYDGTDSKLYLNGTLVDEGNGSDTDTANDTGIGTKRLGGGLWSGNVDDARIYNRALSPEEVHQLYQWGTKGEDFRRTTTTTDKSDMVAWWKLNETSGSTAEDSSGNEYNASVNGAETAGSSTESDPIGGSAYIFDGDNDYVRSDFKDLDAVSVSAWIKTDVLSGNFRRIAIAENGSTKPQWSITKTDNSDLRFSIAGNSAYSDTIGKDEWIHTAGTYDPSTGDVKIYVNGTQEGSTTSTQDRSGTTKISIGGWRDEDTQYWDGSLSNIRVYNRPLTPQEVSYLYEQKF